MRMREGERGRTKAIGKIPAPRRTHTAGFQRTAPRAILHLVQPLTRSRTSMSHRTSLLLGALVLAPSVVAAQSARPLPLKRRPQPTTAAITENDLMSRLYVF